MKNELEMTLSSRWILTESGATEQIAALSEFSGGLMRPDKCSQFEPIREPFDPSDIQEHARRLAQAHGSFFYRKGRPVHMSGQIWNRSNAPEAHFPSPLFSNYWTSQFDGDWARRVGIEKIEEFVSAMFRLTGSDFGLLTTEVDRKVKNTSATSSSYQGFDPASGIPGLYWLNFFSGKLADWLDLSSLPNELASRTVLESGEVVLKFCATVDDCRNLDVLERQRAAINWIGSDRFFDIRFPERVTRTPDWKSVYTTTVAS